MRSEVKQHLDGVHVSWGENRLGIFVAAAQPVAGGRMWQLQLDINLKIYLSPIRRHERHLLFTSPAQQLLLDMARMRII